MTEIRFYHLTRSTLEQTLPELLEMTLQRSLKAVVMAGSDERVESITQHLWTYKPDSFLPHGSSKDGNADLQPVWLTTLDENPNGATFLFLTDGAITSKAADYTRVCEIFDGNDDDALTSARQRWAAYKAAGHTLSYWQQAGRGWEDKTPK